MGLVSSEYSTPSTLSSPILSLEEALLLPPNLNVYKDEIEGHLIEVSFTIFTLFSLFDWQSFPYLPLRNIFRCFFIVPHICSHVLIHVCQFSIFFCRLWIWIIENSLKRYLKYALCQIFLHTWKMLKILLDWKSN